jgi:hypothetical protein
MLSHAGQRFQGFRRCFLQCGNANEAAERRFAVTAVRFAGTAIL